MISRARRESEISVADDLPAARETRADSEVLGAPAHGAKPGHARYVETGRAGTAARERQAASLASASEPATALEPATAAEPASAGRLGHVDGLRALAAFAVALFHCAGYAPAINAALPWLLALPIRYGYLGVHVFFVLSGFVIAHNLRDAEYSATFVGRFALRRSLRLDLPYWATLAVAAACLSRDPTMAPRLRLPSILAHVVYAQYILHYPSLLDIFWTLCIEVQLYLVCVLLAWGAQSLARRVALFTQERSGRRGRASVEDWREWAFAAMTFFSHALAFAGLSTRLAPWFIIYWYMFALGAFTRWALERPSARIWLVLWIALALLRGHRLHGPGPALCVATVAVLYGAHHFRIVGRVFGAGPLARFGRSSYSFYLLHVLVASEVFAHVNKLGTPSLLRDFIGMGTALVLAAVAAEIWFRYIEQPAIRLSRRVRLPEHRPHRPHRPQRARPAARALTSV